MYRKAISTSLFIEAGKNYQFSGLASFLDDCTASAIISTTPSLTFRALRTARLLSNCSPFLLWINCMKYSANI
jgi:hypothetical protein